jgi:hypothetical protein
MVSAVRERGRPVWYFRALNEVHGFAKKENRDLANLGVVAFFLRRTCGETTRVALQPSTQPITPRALLSAGAHELGALAQTGVRYRYRALPTLVGAT